MVNVEKQKFWDARADLGERSGSNDFILKRIEIKLLRELVTPGSSVLDIGCGNGQTLVELACHNQIKGIGVDFAPSMVKAAIEQSQQAKVINQVTFEQGYLPALRKDLGQFDFAITERCLINLDDFKSQHQAFLNIMEHVKPGGYYLMIEDSFDGLEKMNALRQQVQLEPIAPPWHNTFFHEKDVLTWANKNVVLDRFLPFTSTYYLLSRVVYAHLAKTKGEELKYDSEINLLATQLPNMGDIGAVRMWVWKKIS